MIWKIIIGASIVCNSFSFYALASDYEFSNEVGVFYKLHTVKQNWKEASKTCRNEGGLIAMPLNKHEMNAIQSLVIDYFKFNQTTEPMPSDILLGFHQWFIFGEPITETGISIQYAFDKFSPDEKHDKLENKCGSAKLEVGQLKYIDCHKTAIFVCQKEVDVQSISSDGDTSDEMSLMKIKECPFSLANNYSWITGQPSDWGYDNCGTDQQNDVKPMKLKSVYKLNLSGKVWAVARTLCDAEGGHLAIIDNAAEQELLMNMLNESMNQVTYSENDVAWLGFHNQFIEGDFVTVIGTPLLYNVKDLKGSANNCGAIDFKGTVKSIEDCNTPHRFICEKKVPVDTKCIKNLTITV